DGVGGGVRRGAVRDRRRRDAAGGAAGGVRARRRVGHPRARASSNLPWRLPAVRTAVAGVLGRSRDGRCGPLSAVFFRRRFTDVPALRTPHLHAGVLARGWGTHLLVSAALPLDERRPAPAVR